MGGFGGKKGDGETDDVMITSKNKSPMGCPWRLCRFGSPIIIPGGRWWRGGAVGKRWHCPPSPRPPTRDLPGTLECSEALGDPLSLPLQTGKSHMARGVLWALRRGGGCGCLWSRRQIISRWIWVGLGLSPEPGNRREEEEDSTGGRGWQVRLLAGRMYSEGCLARGGRGWGTCECLDGPAHPTPGKVSPGETRVSVSALEGAGGP